MSRLALTAFGRRLSWCLSAVLLFPVAALAQEVIRDSPAHIALVDGSAVVERDGQTDRAPSSMPLLAGDRVRTQIGRVEILFSDGSTLHLDHNTVVDFQSDEVIRLLDGRVRLAIAGPARSLAYRIDAPTAWVDIKQPGEYRVALVAGPRGREVELGVLRGSADLVNDGGSTDVRAGERAFASAGQAPSEPYVYNSAAWDAFDRWSEDRRDARLGLSAQYLPSEVRHYSSTLDEYGSWQYESQYGYVWYPRVAVAGWRPYYHGRWAHLRPYGWTWIGADPWAWPTHHYGRWGFSAGLWFWIPGRVWGPAWVSWAYAPGYVSWCPLGWNNRAVFGFSINHHGGRRYDPWHAWTVVPHRRFGSGFVNVNVVNVNHINVRSRGAFVERAGAPDHVGYAVPRAQTPIRMAGTRGGFAVPRGDSTAGERTTPSLGMPGREPSDAVRPRTGAPSSSAGQGFPAPSREPRPGAMPRTGEAPAARPRERAPSAAAPAEGGAIRRESPGGAPAAAPAEGRTPSRRAVPRGEAPAASPSGAGSTSAPSRGSGSSSTPAPSSSSGGSGRSRAVPRGRGGASDVPSLPAPASRTEAVPDRAPQVFRGRIPSEAPRQPAQPTWSGERATRRAPEAVPPPAISSPGVDRGVRQSGPPAGRLRVYEARPSPAPSTGPPSRSAPPRGAAPAPSPAPSGRAPSAQPQGRSRGGQAPAGRAVPRGGGR